MTVDFGLVRNPDGTLTPKLVELQAFPSIFGYQDLLAHQYIETYNLDPNLNCHLSRPQPNKPTGNSSRKVIVGDHDPENVVLLEIDPDHQKTLPDFHVYEDKLHIATVDIAKLRKQGNRLFYQRDGREIPIHRIYNRAIVDELERKNIQLPFDYRDRARRRVGRPSQLVLPHQQILPAHPSTTLLSPKPSSSTTGSPSATSKAFPINAKASSSSRSTPLQAREFSSPPLTKTSTPSPSPTAISISFRNESPSSPPSTLPTAPLRQKSASCTSGPTAAHSNPLSHSCASAAD